MHQLNDEQQKLAFEKHIFGSDWYSHIKIFWTKKTNNQWFIKELKLKFFFDKLPISFFILCVAICILMLLLIIGFYIATHLIANGQAQTYLQIFQGVCK
jgi:hypothetical protein